MRQLTAAISVAAIGVLLAACGGSNEGGSGSSTTTSSRPPAAQAALPGFLLTSADIDGALGVTGSKSKEKSDKLQDDNAKQPWPAGWKFPDDCIYAIGPGQAPVYAGSGYTAVSGDEEVASAPPDSNEPDPEVSQVAVLFPTAKEANAFFATSAQRWPACANRQFTTPAGQDTPETGWQVGPVSNTNGVLSTTLTMTLRDNGNVLLTMTCQRALTVRNNVAVDVGAVRKDPVDLAVKLAGQIAGRVGKQ
ncbi:sensor domain-containing protein [Mycobacterium sp. SMC-2]|uniref:sensor domain-containing protein n=1 Tax=Mycobacterium sp. SMC-2 TaxID=2857058 RepID=UPI0021B354E9|nr:sensor domain-containing protein [Mycobacterium sp. SMC-2]UXA04784.1 sensor domain-containing protein [Mycobacterium sp. SMC-2]